MGTTLEQVAAELYALPLEEFTPRRTARARELRAEDKELVDAVGRLPKPALSAWAVDRLARERPDDLDDLLALGEQLREAQQEQDSERVKALTGNAQALVRRTVRAVSEVAGVPLSDALLGQVEQTLRAAMADEGAGAVLRAGVLAKPLAPAGFGPVELDGAVAVIPAARPVRERRLSVVRPSPAERKKDDRAAAAQQEAERAAARLERAEAELAERDEALRAAQEQHEEATRRRDEFRAAVTQAEQEEQAAARRVREAHKEQEKAARQAERAREAAVRATKALDAL
jgi:hypothetical protein